MIIKRGDAQILNIIPEEELEEEQKIATKIIAQNLPNKNNVPKIKEEKKN